MKIQVLYVTFTHVDEFESAENKQLMPMTFVVYKQ